MASANTPAHGTGIGAALSLRLRSAARIVRTPIGALWTAGGAAVLIATGALGFTTLFSTFAAQDDEGYFLITIKGYLSGAKLYDQTYGSYGPFYFQFMAGAFTVLGLDVTNDSGRLITLGLWIGAASVLAVAAYRMSHNLLLAAVVYVLAVYDLKSAPTEPTHPGHLLMLLLAAMVAVAALATERRPRLAFALLGALTAAALLSKVNIGVFAMASLAFAAVLASPGLLRQPRLAVMVSAGFVLIPVALMARYVVRRGYVVYATHVVLVALALTLVALGTARRRDRDAGSSSWLLHAAAGAAGLTAVACGIVLAQGTSLSGLVHSVVLDALAQPDIFSGPLGLPTNVIALDAVGVAVAAAIGLGALPHARPWPLVGALGRIAAGIWILTAVASSQPLVVPVALAWVAAIPTRNEAPTPERRFVRLFVPALAVLQVLHAFPVAGSQIRWAAFLLIAVGAVCVADGLSELGVTRLELGRPAARLAAAGALGVAIWVGFVALVLPLGDSVAAYRAGTPLRAAGAEWIRVPKSTAQEYDSLVKAIRRRCTTFVSMPGLGSLYLMSEEKPPTWLNISAWLFRWDTKTQQHVVEQVRDVPGLCAVRNLTVEDFWAQGRPIPNRPLRAFILDDFRTVVRLQDFTLGRRLSAG